MKLVLNYLSNHLKVSLEYKVSFILSMISQGMYMLIDNFSKIIIRGDFDILLIRPRNIYLQIFGSDICYEKTSRVLVSLGLFIYSSIRLIDSFNIVKILLLFNMLLGGILLFVGIFILGATMCFFTVQGLEVVNIITNGSKQFAEYPMRIYKKTLRMIFTFIIPVTIINYYPINYLVGNTNNILYVFMPLISVIVLIIGVLVFNIGISKYCSTGS